MNDAVTNGIHDHRSYPNIVLIVNVDHPIGTDQRLNNQDQNLRKKETDTIQKRERREIDDKIIFN